MKKIKNDGWRYQAVYNEYDTDETEKSSEYSVCEVYLDKDGKLTAWTEDNQMSPYGETLDELLGDLQYMIDDVRKWKPVPFASLKIGMTFEQAVKHIST